ncbi:hypothetical protein MRX96_037392 [Rhipicephalus microplus]
MRPSSFQIPHASAVALFVCLLVAAGAEPQHYDGETRREDDVAVRLARFVESLYEDLEEAAQTNVAKPFPSHEAFHEFHNQPVRPFQQGRSPGSGGAASPPPTRPPPGSSGQPVAPPGATTPPRRPPGTALFGEPFEPPNEPQKPPAPSRGTGGYGRPEGPLLPPSNVLEPEIVGPVLEYEPPDLPQRPPVFSGYPINTIDLPPAPPRQPPKPRPSPPPAAPQPPKFVGVLIPADKTPVLPQPPFPPSGPPAPRPPTSRPPAPRPPPSPRPPAPRPPAPRPPAPGTSRVPPTPPPPFARPPSGVGGISFDVQTGVSKPGPGQPPVTPGPPEDGFGYGPPKAPSSFSFTTWPRSLTSAT